MNRTRLEYLFDLCIKDEATLEQRQELLELLNLPENEVVAKELLRDAYEMPKQTQDVDSETRASILATIFDTDRRERARRIFVLKKQIVRWSAVAAIFTVIFLGVYFFAQKRQRVQIAKTSGMPGGNKATLILANGSKIDLNDAKNGEIARQSGLSIKKTKSGQLVYTIVNQKVAPKSATNILAYNTIETPIGGQYQVNLPDGTKVWLNAASSLRYPTTFASNERRVELTGEGYFEVAHDKAKPFKVVSNKQEIEVLGTHFNVNAYTDENAIKTTLLEGIVKVFVDEQHQTKQPSTILKPGEQSVLDNMGLIVQNVDVEDAVAWKNGLFEFTDADTRSVMRQLSRWYDVDIIYEKDLPVREFSGVISRNVNLSQALDVLSFAKIHFRIEGKTITVMR